MSRSKASLSPVLSRLDQIGKAINGLSADDLSRVRSVLQWIVESTGEVLPGSSAVLMTYDAQKDAFDPESRMEAGNAYLTLQNTSALVNGIGRRVVAGKKRIITYKAAEFFARLPATSVETAAIACFPLTVSTEVMGVLYVYTRQENRLSITELTVLEIIANLAAMTLSKDRQFSSAQQEQLRKERELRRLRRAGMLISSRSSLKDTLETILRMALEVTDASYGIFRLVDPGGQNLITAAFVGEGLEKPAVEAIPIQEKSVMGYVAVRREPVVISDLHAEPWGKIYYPLDHAMEMRSEVAVPLIGASGRLEGVLNLESPAMNAFTRQDRYILQILATQAVVAIQDVRLLNALQDIFALLSTGSLEQVHRALVSCACDLLNVPTSLIWLVEKDQLVIQAATDAALCGRRVSLEEGYAGKVVRTGQPLFLNDVGNVASVNSPELDSLNRGGAALILPIFASDEGRAVGVFSVCTAPGDVRDFSQSEWDKKVLTILGHYAALAVQNADHLDALRIAQDQHATAETFAAIGDIAANLMHRLNNKMGTIPVRIEGIQDKCEAALDADPYLAANLDEIQRSAAEAMDIVRESLSHLRPIQLAPVSVSACLIDALTATILPAHVRLECSGLEELPSVLAGANRLALVFSNLLDNAVDAMEGSGSIRIQGRTRGKWVEVQVSDTGPGIAPDLHERIFEFDYSSRAASQPGKLGFGLWWVKSLMTRFGGTVSVVSDGRQGATFILNLPRAVEE